MTWKILPNLLTTLRIILLAPIIAALLTQRYQLAFYLFLIAGLSDCFDGLLARRFQWTTRYGAMADPLADKLLLMGSFITLAVMGHIPYILVYVVIIRDVWILCGALAYHFFIGEPQFAPSCLSKYNTFLQIILISAILVNLSVAPLPQVSLQILMGAVFFLSVASAIDYTCVWGQRAWITTQQKSNGKTTYL
jgi:cardiolipin synthase